MNLTQTEYFDEICKNSPKRRNPDFRRRNLNTEIGRKPIRKDRKLMRMQFKRIILTLFALVLIVAAVPFPGAASEAEPGSGMTYDEWREQLLIAPRLTFTRHPDGIARGTCPVYLAPDPGALRLANGYQEVDTNHDLYEGGYTENGWLFVRYMNSKGYTRVGYIPGKDVKRFKSSMSLRTFARIGAVAADTIPVTDNPVKDGVAFTELAAGDSFVILGKYTYTGNWWYIECTVGEKPARGFISREDAVFYPGDEVADNMNQAPLTLERLGIPEKSPLGTEQTGEITVNEDTGNNRIRVRGDADPDSQWLTAVYPGKSYPCYGVKTGAKDRDWYYIFVEEDSVWGYVLGSFVTFEE